MQDGQLDLSIRGHRLEVAAVPEMLSRVPLTCDESLRNCSRSWPNSCLDGLFNLRITEKFFTTRHPWIAAKQCLP